MRAYKMSSIEERYAKQIVGRLECLDRVVIRGTLPGVCYAQGMTSWLYEHKIRIFDYLKVDPSKSATDSRRSDRRVEPTSR